MKRTIIICAFAAAISWLAGCGGTEKNRAAVPALDPANMDTSVDPAADFYRYANGGWIRNNPLPPEYSRYGVYFKLAEDNLEQLRSIIGDAAKMDQTQGAAAQKITTLHNLAMDERRLNAQGAGPIMEQLAEIGAVGDHTQLAAMIASLHRERLFPYFGIAVGADQKNSDMNVAMLYQGGIMLGDRDYYLENTPETEAIREAYKAYIAKLFTLSGCDEGQAAAAVDAVMKIEERMARASYTREVLRDPEKNYDKMRGAEWAASNSLIDWAVYFDRLGLDPADELVIKQKDFFADLTKIMDEVTLDEHKLYMKFNLINMAASFLSDDFVNASFDFYQRTLSGREELHPRWKRALTMVSGVLDQAVGKLYVEKYFPASSKEKMTRLVTEIKAAFGQRIDALEWMSDATKARAHEKLAALDVKIGYPDKWRSYDALDIRDDSYWANVRRCFAFRMEEKLAEVGKPVDRDEWRMSPHTVDAYYNNTTNKMFYPAAILQPPFFNPDADAAVNYGAIGVVIGHEITHGFDDQGRRYDKDGNMSDWWEADDAAQFTALADILVGQYDAIEVATGVYANGRFTLGENIADQGGLVVARLAYENSLAGKKRPDPIGGFTDSQRFYLAFATLWAENVRPEEVLRMTKLDPHSLAVNRVNATLRNIADFYETFGVKEGDPMYLAPPERVVIW